MTVPKKFSVSIQPIQARYDAIDITKGKIIQTLFAARGKTDVLSDQAFYSEEIETNVTHSSQTDTLITDVDFDVEFEMTRLIEGKIVCAIPLGIKQGDSSGMNTYVKVKVRHFDGSIETELADTTSQTLTYSGAGTITRVMNVEVDVGRRIFKKGEILRITIEHWAKDDNNITNTAHYGLGHDPKNRVGIAANTAFTSGSVTQMSFQIPFVIKQ